MHWTTCMACTREEIANWPKTESHPHCRYLTWKQYLQRVEGFQSNEGIRGQQRDLVVTQVSAKERQCAWNLSQECCRKSTKERKGMGEFWGGLQLIITGCLWALPNTKITPWDHEAGGGKYEEQLILTPFLWDCWTEWTGRRNYRTPGQFVRNETKAGWEWQNLHHQNLLNSRQRETKTHTAEPVNYRLGNVNSFNAWKSLKWFYLFKWTAVPRSCSVLRAVWVGKF